jgi:Ras-related protein Rab-5C
LLFFETSAKDGTGVSEVFAAIANAIPETQLKSARGPGAAGQGGQSSGRVTLDEGLGQQRKGSDCSC